MNHYPLISSGPWPTLAITAGYLYFVKVAGPAFMKSRGPLNVKPAMIYYNLLLVGLSAWMALEALLASNFMLNSWSCSASQRIVSSKEPHEELLFNRGAFFLWVFFFSKFLEFSDTIFMVLRKKDNQITKLHLIHHCVVPISIWLTVKYSPFPISMWFPFLNCSVHTFMYSYYGLMALDDFLGDSIKHQLLRFKPWITRIQIMQFCLGIGHVLFMLAYSSRNSSCVLPKSFVYPFLFQGLLFLVLFLDFYFTNYFHRKKVRKSGISKIDHYAINTQTTVQSDDHKRQRSIKSLGHLKGENF